jgi:hypothetical protein
MKTMGLKWNSPFEKLYRERGKDRAREKVYMCKWTSGSMYSSELTNDQSRRIAESRHSTGFYL